MNAVTLLLLSALLSVCSGQGSVCSSESNSPCMAQCGDNRLNISGVMTYP